MTRLANPTPLFLNSRGTLLDGAYVYIGTAGTNPTQASNRLALFWDRARTIPAAQPLRTVGGAIVNGDDPAFVYFAEADYSITVLDVGGALVLYSPNASEINDTYQPLDSDLTAIASQGTSAFGRSLLALSDGPALKTAAGVVDGLDVKFQDLPLFTQIAAFNFTALMRGGAVNFTGGAAVATIPPESAFAWGTSNVAAIVVRNNGSGALTITRGTGVSLKKNGSTSSADATLAVGGVATLLRFAADDWVLSGTGIS